MSVRINGVSHRSACDIQILMESRDNLPALSAEERERRIQLYTERASAGLGLFDGETCEDTMDDTDVCDVCGCECARNDNGLVSVCDDCREPENDAWTDNLWLDCDYTR